MLANQAQACEVVNMLPAASRSAGAANGSYVDLSKYEGDAVFVVNTGAITGSVIVKVEDATDSGGTGLADVTGAVTSSISSANTVAKIIVPCSKLRSHVRVTATVTTGPVLVGVSLMAHPKYV
ncbi:MAG: hypothetical protein IPM99_18790 [Rubrivivax sp.]|nr:hypothetical protein [Rubrivivax sp.]